MAFGVLERSDADIAVGITGIAGPSGGAKKSPSARGVDCYCKKG